MLAWCRLDDGRLAGVIEVTKVQYKTGRKIEFQWKPSWPSFQTMERIN